MDGYESLIGKNVVVTKNDNFRKYGRLKSVNNTVLILIFNDGKEVYIPMATVTSVALDLWVGR